MNIQRNQWRDIALYLVLLMERHDLVGAWRVRSWFESKIFLISQDKPVLCSTAQGVQIVLEPQHDNGVEKSIFRTGTYEGGTLAVMAGVLKTGSRFLDVGTNVGLMSLYAAKLVGPTGRVDSFEPLPEIRRLLSSSIEINSFNNIVVHPIALGSEPARLKLYRHLEVNRGSSSLAWTGDEHETIEIEVDTLDHVMAEQPGQPTEMIKIDVEGWELEVLRGAAESLTQSYQPVLCVEFSLLRPLHGGTYDDIMTLLEGYGYEAYQLAGSKSKASPLKVVDRHALPEHDNLFFFPKARLQEFNAKLFV